MTPQKIFKYYYHEYVQFAFLLLAVTALVAIFALDFTPIPKVKIGAIIIATLMYLIIGIYFYILHRRGE